MDIMYSVQLQHIVAGLQKRACNNMSGSVEGFVKTVTLNISPSSSARL